MCLGHLFAFFDVSYGVEDEVEEGGFSEDEEYCGGEDVGWDGCGGGY